MSYIVVYISKEVALSCWNTKAEAMRYQLNQGVRATTKIITLRG